MNNTNKLSNEINSFKQIWQGGFRTGYSPKRNQKGLEDYLLNGLSGKTCLEIGCGGGQWSKHIYNQNIFDKIYCIFLLLPCNGYVSDIDCPVSIYLSIILYKVSISGTLSSN